MHPKTLSRIVPVAVLATAVSAGAAEPKFPELLIARPTAVQFEVSAGRILATGTRFRQNQTVAARKDPTGYEEHLAIAVDRGLLSVRYQLESEIQQLEIHITRRDRCEIRWHSQLGSEDSVLVNFVQPVAGPVSLKVEPASGEPSILSAPSIWHLLLSHESTCQRHLIPVFEAMRPNWHIRAELSAIRRMLCDPQVLPPGISEQDVWNQVNRLGSKNYRERRDATLRLQAMGQGVCVVLGRLDLSTLDREQRLRVTQIQRGILHAVPDTPQRVALWLTGDDTIRVSQLDDTTRNTLNGTAER
jgi:hypothetical protein